MIRNSISCDSQNVRIKLFNLLFLNPSILPDSKGRQFATSIGMSRLSSWFEELFGFAEPKFHRHREIQNSFEIVESRDFGGELVLRSKVNGRQFHIGNFATPRLDVLRTQGRDILSAIGDRDSESRVKIKHQAITDVLRMHSTNPGALFQAASQFNCLEMAQPEAVPEHGVTIYGSDPTQGPACAIACAAGTVYRNYFAPVASRDGALQVGQTRDLQINNLSDIEEAIGNEQHKYWQIHNGYCFSERKKLRNLHELLTSGAVDLNALRDALRIGLHVDVGVTFADRSAPLFIEKGEDIRVSQAYCSALSCAYSGINDSDIWEPFAKLVLEASYEATLWATVRNSAHPRGSNKVFLTFVGGGVFGNKLEWISDAIGRAAAILDSEGADIDITVCHYRSIRTEVVERVDTAYQAEALRLRGK